jgi:L-alanine-DL-glutamate epimerase-like enolase superfamily enzyme
MYEITGIDLFPIRIGPHIGEFTQPRRQMMPEFMQRKQGKFTPNVVVRIWANDGSYGIGEAIPRPHINGEILESTTAMLEHCFAPAIIGEDPFNVGHIMEILDGASDWMMGSKCGIDLELYDLIGKLSDRPVFDLIGGAVHKEFIQRGDWDPVSDKSIGIPSREKTGDLSIKEWENLLDQPIPYCKWYKMKLGDDPFSDVKKYRLVREKLGHETYILVDANQGWRNAETAIWVIKKLVEIGVDMVEQPVHWWDLEGLKKVRDSVEVSICADESIRTPIDAVRLIKMGAADTFNIKLVKSGGIHRLKMISNITDAANFPVYVGTSQPGTIQLLANYHCLATIRNLIPDWHGYPQSSALMGGTGRADIVRKGVPPGEKAPDKPGLGFELDMDLVEKYIVRKIPRITK